jgi:hypothetical protein
MHREGCTVEAVDVIGGAGRQLLRTLLVCAGVVVTAVAAMAGLATGSLLVFAAIVAPVIGLSALAVGGRGMRWRTARERRQLVRRVGDPLTLSGDWRRLLASAWTARDEFSAAANSYAGSPVGERLQGQQAVVDAALEHCGELARCGQRLFAQHKAFRPRRLRRDLLLERGRDRHGDRATALARQLDDVERLRGELDRIRLQLEHQVHDMRTAAWRASTLRSGVTTDEPDEALAELLDDLAHLREALAEVERPAPRAAAVS